MKKVKAIIIDDERPARKELAFLLNDIPEVSIIGDTDNLKDAVDLINAKKPDLVFLDIQLTGENGFDLLEKVRMDFHVIFVTAYDEFAIKAFEVNATDYLLKPVDPERLEKSLQRILMNSSPKNTISKKFTYDDSIYVKLNNCSARFIEINSIIAISSVGNYTKLQTTDGNNYLVLKTLKRWEEELPANFFIRIHRATIINIKYIQKISNYSKNHHQVAMKEIETPFEISRSCYKNLKNVNK